MAKTGKRLKKAYEGIDPDASPVKVDEAVKLVKERAKDNGIFKLRDAKSGEELKLEFVGTHQPVRRLQQDGRFFACTDFRKEGTKDQFYDVDFWVNEKNGKMTVNEVRLHKVPEKQADGSYIQVPRYNFDDLKFDVVP